MASNGVTRPPALDVTMQEILDALKAVSFRPQVIDNLTSQDSGAPLSANQGRVLKDAIDDIVTQSITDGDTSHAPSGDAVHDALNAINTYQRIELDSSEMTFDTPLSLYGENYLEIIGDMCILHFNIKITNAPSLAGYNIDDYLPSGYRPRIGCNFCGDTGLADGKAQGVSIVTNGRITIWPVNLNTTTYAIGTGVFFK